MPWCHILEAKYEFRLFIHAGQIKACSQQNCYDIFDYTEKELENIIDALNNIKWLPLVEYKNFIADIYYDTATKTMKLIECNSFGAFAPGGSALFDWNKDYNLLHYDYSAVDNMSNNNNDSNNIKIKELRILQQ